MSVQSLSCNSPRGADRSTAAISKPPFASGASATAMPLSQGSLGEVLGGARVPCFGDWLNRQNESPGPKAHHPQLLEVTHLDDKDPWLPQLAKI